MKGALFVLVAVALASGCTKSTPQSVPAAAVKHHEHVAPHGGTAVVLGDEVYHLELVLTPNDGRMNAYVLDGEMENFVRVGAPSFRLSIQLPDGFRELEFRALASSATGETVGDTAAFEAQAEWLKTAKSFNAVLPKFSIRGQTFENVKFNFPGGNEPGSRETSRQDDR